MLGISRGLIQNPKLILMDEPSVGLAPKLVGLTMGTIRKIGSQFKVTLLVVEQNVREVLKIVDRAYVLRLGRIILEESSVTPESEQRIRSVFLG
jgi:branched-chain amino acid transport system ATP-binding protein